jgi:hypothetical protein
MIGNIAKEDIVFVDETGIDKYLYRPHGRAPKGQRVSGKVSGKKYKRVGIAADLCGKRIVSPLQYSSSMNGGLFHTRLRPMLHLHSAVRGTVPQKQRCDTADLNANWYQFWVEKQLLPHLKERSVIVMDNASCHSKKTLPGIERKAGCRIVFPPPYSPDLNPIEKFWAWLKSRLRKVLSNFSSLDDALTDCFKVV